MRLLIFIVVSVFYLLHQSYLSLYIPFIWPDEVLFYNPAEEFWLNQKLRTTVLEGFIPGMEEATLWMPPLYMLGLGLWFSLLGSGIENARIFANLFGWASCIITLAFFYKLFPKQKKFYVYLIPFLFILLDIQFLNITNTSRMESMCSFFGIVSIYLIYSQKFFWGGVALGLSCLAHPFGAFYAIPNLYLSFFNTKNKTNMTVIKNLSWIVVGFFLIFLGWLVYVFQNLDLFFLQFGAQLVRKKELLSHLGMIDKLRTLIHFYPVGILKLFIFLLIPSLALFYNKDPYLAKKVRLGFVWYFSMLIGFYTSSETWYAYHLVYPMALLFLILLVVYTNNLINYFKNLHTSVLIFIGFYSIYAFFWFHISQYYPENARKKTKEFMKIVEEIAKPHSTIYLQLIPDPYFHLKNLYPNKQLWEFIPGELSIYHENLKASWKRIELFLFYNDAYMHPSLREFLQFNPSFQRKEISIPYNSKVPGKGPWKIIYYEKSNN